MIKGKRSAILVLLGILSYLLFLVISLPAAHAWRLIDGQAEPVRAYGLSGTVWDGAAARVDVGQRQLIDLDWELHPSTLLTGRLAADVAARVRDGAARGYVSLSRDSVYAENIKLDMPATTLLDWTGLARMPVQVDGHFEALLREVAVAGTALERAEGLLNWNNATVRLGGPLALGDLALQLKPAADGIDGELVNEGGAIDITGDLHIAPAGTFVLDMVVKATPEADEPSLRAMRFLGVPADGTPIRSRLTGSLSGQGLRLERVNR